MSRRAPLAKGRYQDARRSAPLFAIHPNPAVAVPVEMSLAIQNLGFSQAISQTSLLMPCGYQVFDKWSFV